LLAKRRALAPTSACDTLAAMVLTPLPASLAMTLALAAAFLSKRLIQFIMHVCEGCVAISLTATAENEE
jgi:hypothetical protein